MINGRSIRLRLIVMLTSTILLVWLVVLVLVYLVAEHEVEEVLMPTWHKTHTFFKPCCCMKLRKS